jgi:hypothetical protein
LKVTLTQTQSGTAEAATRRSERAAGCGREHHEGNGHGDMVRLRQGELLRGVRASRETRSNGSSDSSIGMKRGEPQDRQQGAINLRISGGETRRGGEKPRGRNTKIGEESPVPKRRWQHLRGSGRRGPCRWRGDDETQERKVGTYTDRGHDCSALKRNEAGEGRFRRGGNTPSRPRRSRRALEGPPGDWQDRGGSGKVQRPATRMTHGTLKSR